MLSCLEPAMLRGIGRYSAFLWSALWYPAGMQVWINGQARSFSELPTVATLDQMIAILAIKADRVAIEQNGNIVPRTEWGAAPVRDGDRFEIVHFVGGGA